MNLYQYAQQNPLDYRDPFGLCVVCVSVGPLTFAPLAPVENLVEDAEQVGEWASHAPEVISEVWGATAPFIQNCAENGLVGAATGAIFGAAAGGAGAVPGAIAGGATGCGEGLVDQGLREVGQDEAAEIIKAAEIAHNLGKAGEEGIKQIPPGTGARIIQGIGSVVRK